MRTTIVPFKIIQVLRELEEMAAAVEPEEKAVAFQEVMLLKPEMMVEVPHQLA